MRQNENPSGVEELLGVSFEVRCYWQADEPKIVDDIRRHGRRTLARVSLRRWRASASLTAAWVRRKERGHTRAVPENSTFNLL